MRVHYTLENIIFTNTIPIGRVKVRRVLEAIYCRGNILCILLFRVTESKYNADQKNHVKRNLAKH